MDVLEEFFKNRIFFTPYLNEMSIHRFYISENVFNPEDYTLDFLKEKANHFVII